MISIQILYLNVRTIIKRHFLTEKNVAISLNQNLILFEVLCIFSKNDVEIYKSYTAKNDENYKYI